MRRYLPAIEWLSHYSKKMLPADAIAAAVVTVMLIPQSLAYAMLAGVPPEMGLYASVLPLIAYALLGTSRTLSVGPVAIISLMTATAIGEVVQNTGFDYQQASIALAMLSGCLLLLMGLMRFGMLANLLSHPVVVGFITGSSIIIALSQLRHLLGIDASGDNALLLALNIIAALPQANLHTLAIGGAALVFLLWARRGLQPLLEKMGINADNAARISKGGPVLAVILTTLLAWYFDLAASGVALVGHIPSGLPALSVPDMSLPLLRELLVPALLISIIGYVESVSVGKTLAAKRRQRIHSNQELVGLGAANIASSLSGGIPVTGGFSRSVVNFDAGAKTQMASILAALGIALAAVFLTPYLAFLPSATLAATIVVAISSLVDFKAIRQAWNYSMTDFAAVSVTILATLSLGVELGVVSGIAISIVLHLYKTSRPHMAIVGEVPGTEHFRNIDRHQVITCPHIVTLRIDESLYFANAGFVEDSIYSIIAGSDEVEHIILMCPAINEIDLSAFEALESINQRLGELGIGFHFSEVKGPVMDCLQRTNFLDQLNGNVYLSQHQAIADLDSEGKRFVHTTSSATEKPSC